MPSILDLFEGGDDTPPGGFEPRPGVLAAVKSEGGRRRTSRRRRAGIVALLGLAAVAVPVAALNRGDGADRPPVDVAAAGAGAADPSPLPTVDPVPPATTIPEPVVTLPDATYQFSGITPTPDPVVPPPAPTSTTTAAPAPTPAPAPASARAPARGPAQTTTTARVCRNSFDAACGAFRWDPSPSPNQALVAAFTTAPATAVAGQAVPFEVTWSDADAAALSYDHLSTDGSALAPSCSILPRHGPWTPPAPAPGRGTLRYSPTFPNAGTYTVIVSLGSADCSSPYSSDNQASATVVVSAPKMP